MPIHTLSWVVSTQFSHTSLLLELEIIDLVGKVIQQTESNQIPIKFYLSGHLQSRCQQCVPVGNKTGANRAVL